MRDRARYAYALNNSGHPLPALRLWAATDRMRRELRAQVPSPLAERRARTRKAAMAAVDRAAFTAAESAGQGLDVDRALAAAELAPRTAPPATGSARE